MAGKSQLTIEAGELDGLASKLQLLSDPTRLRMVSHLSSDGPLSVGEVVSLLGREQTNVSAHLAKLRLSGLVSGVRDGKRVYYSLTDSGRRAAKAIKEMGS